MQRRDQHGLVRNGFPTTNVHATEFASVCTEFWLCEYAWWTKSGSFPNLGVNPMSCQGNMLIGPVGASLGGLTPQAAQIQEVMAMLGSMSEGQIRQCSKSWKFTAIGCLRQKRKMVDTGTNISRNLEDKRRRGLRLGWLFGLVVILGSWW